MKKNAIVISIFILVFLSSCMFFQTINQPTMSLPNEIITVSINVTTEGGEYEPCFGICLPIGWTIPGDSIQCSGAYNEVIYYDSLVSLQQESESPAPTGYYWWAGKGAVDTSAIGFVSADLLVQTDNQIGRFFIDYMLGTPGNYGVNKQRSNDHQIDIVNEYTPSYLQGTVVGESVILTWDEPLNTSGLLGYNIYRDEHQINPVLITGTSFIDENPLEGIHYYAISSYYNYGSEYLIPYEVQVMYGNCLYVSPYGSDNCSGSSFGDPLQTINFALSILTPDSLNHKTIYLSEGVFSPSSNGEVFPINWKNHISMIGISKEETFLNADSLSMVLHCDSITEAKFENLTIMNGFNSSADGGGIYCYYSSPEFINIRVQNNFAQYNGGGIYCLQSSPKLIGVEIVNNSSASGAGIYTWSNSNVKLLDVIIAENYAEHSGGGICSSDDLQLVNVNITGNSAGHGGGIYCANSSPSLENVIIEDNFAAQYGGGMHCMSSTPLLLNVTMTGNSAGEFGGGIYCSYESNPILKNCILWGDSLSEIYFSASSPFAPNTITIWYSDIQSGEAGIVTNGNGLVNWFEGNIDEDPLFVGTEDYPYTLSIGSPSIDAGDPNPIYDDPEDPNNPGYALWPAMGVLRNDIGAYGGPNAASWNVVTGIEDDETEELQSPTEFVLAQNYPNPFNPSTTIQYSIKERSPVELVLYDILGSQVVVLVNEEQDAGYYKINFNAGRLASGVYLYRLQAGSFVETKKMVLMK